MQPRPHGRGNRLARVQGGAHSKGFNAAAASRPRKSGIEARAPARPRRCFNAAAASRPRKLPPIGDGKVCGQWLQCSRGLTAAEIGISDSSVGEDPKASMQPRPHGRGNRNRHTWPPSRASRLQCSRGLTAAEMSRLRVHGVRTNNASMQPRPHGRGNGESILRAAPGSKLQCSRGLTAAEINPRLRGRSACGQLQCSRGLTAAEILWRPILPSLVTCFNAAAASRPRKWSGF